MATNFLDKVPAKLTVILLTVGFFVLAVIIFYGAIYQNKPFKLGWLELGESTDDLRKKLLAVREEVERRVTSELYEDTKTKASELEEKVSALALEVKTLMKQQTENDKTLKRTKRLLKEKSRELNKIRDKATALKEKLTETEKAFMGLEEQYKQVGNDLSATQKNYEAEAERAKALAAELKTLKVRESEPFIVFVAGKYQAIRLMEGEGVSGDSTKVKGYEKSQVVSVPKDRPVRLIITGYENKIFVPISILQRMTYEDTGQYNEIKQIK